MNAKRNLELEEEVKWVTVIDHKEAVQNSDSTPNCHFVRTFVPPFFTLRDFLLRSYWTISTPTRIANEPSRIEFWICLVELDLIIGRLEFEFELNESRKLSSRPTRSSKSQTRT